MRSPGRAFGSDRLGVFSESSPNARKGAPEELRHLAHLKCREGRRLQLNDIHALALQHVDNVYRLAYHLSDRQGDAEALVLKTFQAGLESRADVEADSNGIRLALFRILCGAVIRRAQAESSAPAGRAAGLSEATAAAGGISREHGSDWSPADRWDEQLLRSIRTLPILHRVAFLLCAAEGLKYREAAAVLGIGDDEVRVLINDARIALSGQIAEVPPPRLDEGNIPDA